MNTLLDYYKGMQGLVIFRGILNDPVMQKLMELLRCCALNADGQVNAYADFAAGLFAHATDFSTYLKTLILEDENFYLHACCASPRPDGCLQECLAHELAFLQKLSLLDGSTVRSTFDYAGYLPAWDCHREDFAAAYAERIHTLPQKGYGIFAHYHMFTVKDGVLIPVKHPDRQTLTELPGYESERAKVIANTEALLQNRPANNVLLYGDAGTGKSSTVKAIANAYRHRGLRLIEVKKNQLYQLPDIMETIYANPLKFIVFIDDLSFSSNDADFSSLKAILEGSVNGQSGNLAVYATSNRRHLIKESWDDRAGSDLHEADTRQELMSLSARFGLTVTFLKPDKKLYLDIVHALADQYGLDVPHDQLDIQAEAHAIRNGGRSPRAAKQFIELTKSGVR
ncbi:MAG: ATP-binding protein [Mailhella sp.]|nr:ATP-binding protein [Mailhella sp.]